MTFLPNRYTESLDYAVELVPGGWQWMASNRAPAPKEGRAYIHNGEMLNIGIGHRNNPKYRGHEVTAATPAQSVGWECVERHGWEPPPSLWSKFNQKRGGGIAVEDVLVFRRSP